MAPQKTLSGIEIQLPSVVTSSIISFEQLSPLLVLDRVGTSTQDFSLVPKQQVIGGPYQ